MKRTPHLLAIDQGTTSTRAIVFDVDGVPVAGSQRELRQHYPQPGWVEHDAEDIWRDTVAVGREAIARACLEVSDIAALGLTNQRETVVVWDRETGDPLCRAVVWQDRRGAGLCESLRRDGHEARIRQVTGLVVDSYFSATKLAWLLDNVPGLRARAESGRAAFGTVDGFLVWRLTGGRLHAIDVTNASRTMLFDIHRRQWDDELLALLRVPRAMLPEVRDCDGGFGATDAGIFGRSIPVGGAAGDQHAATIGQACLEHGSIKSTYGTGCFALLNTGHEPVPSREKLLTTIAYRLGGETSYALEGSIFIAGAAIQWLRDTLGVIASAAQTEQLAARADHGAGVYFVPAFVGLGSPWWDSDVRGAIVGLTQGEGVAEIVAAALEAVCYQTRDLMLAMQGDVGAAPSVLRVDGGMVVNDWLLQRLADLAGVPVERPKVAETTALGAAFLAGLGTGVYTGTADFASRWQLERCFEPRMSDDERETRYRGWIRAVEGVRAVHRRS